jgi:hypothetical protein
MAGVKTVKYSKFIDLRAFLLWNQTLKIEKFKVFKKNLNIAF